MRSRLDRIDDWEERARRALYHVDTLAFEAGVTTEALRLYWSDQRRCCTKVWLKYLRALDALTLLHAGRQIKDVAAAVGFQHAGHFTRAFKAALHLSPRHYARLLSGHPPVLNLALPQLAKMVSFFSWPAIPFRLTTDAQQDGPSHTQIAAYENRVSPPGLGSVSLQLVGRSSSARASPKQCPRPQVR